MSLPRLPGMAMRVAQVVVLVLLAVLLWNVADGQGAWDLLQQANPLWLLAAALVLTLQTVMSAQRWRITAAQLGVYFSPVEAVREYYLAQVVNQSLPGGFVGDANRAVRLRHHAGLVASGQAVVFERVSGQLGLLAVLAFGLAANLVLPTSLIWPDWVKSLLLAILVGVVGTPVILSSIPRLLGPKAGPVARFSKAFKRAVLARAVLPQQIGLSLGTTLCNVFAFALCGVALGISLPFLATLTIVPLILCAMLIPISVSGWGVREGAAALLFPVFGATASEGLATSVAFGLIFLITVVPGLLVIWMRPNAPVFGPH